MYENCLLPGPNLQVRVLIPDYFGGRVFFRTSEKGKIKLPASMPRSDRRNVHVNPQGNILENKWTQVPLSQSKESFLEGDNLTHDGEHGLTALLDCVSEPLCRFELGVE